MKKLLMKLCTCLCVQHKNTVASRSSLVPVKLQIDVLIINKEHSDCLISLQLYSHMVWVK